MSDFMLPDIGEGIVECELVKWLVSEGDMIEEDQPVAEVMTDKALVEIPAPYRGRVSRLYYREGEIAKVHQPLFALVAEGGEQAETSDTPMSSKDEEELAGESAQEQAPPKEPARVVAASETGEEQSEDFILPDIGEGIVECEVVEWRIGEGDEIEEDQPVVDVMTDKAMVEITAPKAGRVTHRYYAKGESARVHSPLFAFVPRDRQEGVKPATSAAPPRHAPTVEPGEGEVTHAGVNLRRQRIPASPAVRRLVREHGLTLADIPGSGKDGRVLKADVLAYLERRPEPVRGAARPQQAETRREERARVEREREVRIEPIKGMQAVMARRMAEAASTIPHFTYGDEIDVTELLALRERLKDEAQAQGTRLTLMPFFMKAVALAVREFPILNSRINDEVTEIHYQPHCNIGMAVDGRGGLIVPNVKSVERLSLLEIAAEVARLTEAAREGRVGQADLKDGTISISNIGALGGTYASPIINAPEVAIVALGRVQRLPRFDDHGGVIERAIMTVSWAGDHRIIDGGTIARFCNRWKGYLESPQSMLLQMG
ncbi:dihydrolipoamide acetyltransferase component of pyruvate dehydrogenase complex [Litchfieldella qijiaojingensis]|uniref:Dihydrolipoamide acetyltransferase component of pyruvate dehydrogenase complex n=1 Tax=Litchfieldella qijiaojingensis TaxID=980347 RepID=A0ABQ2YBI6_9GAMM|nr:dihydrolipoyllysine-residue acetyltransferase [Halomonas qijiaojingensis]GGX78331.1 dihydrolipoamide acetyltransferase component of pyruvate dehydrogenase complex [Halomonas qijiaojingensis]